MDVNSVSFHCSSFCCLLLPLVQKAKFLCSSNVKTILRCLDYFGGGACAEAKVWRLKKKTDFIRHFALFNFSRLSLTYISKYYPILHAHGENIN